MKINDTLSISGPFRLDAVTRLRDGSWRFDLKIRVRERDLEGGGYVLMETDPNGKGLRLTQYNCTWECDFQIDDAFVLPSGADAQEAGCLFAKRMLDLGFSPMLDQHNDPVGNFGSVMDEQEQTPPPPALSSHGCKPTGLTEDQLRATLEWLARINENMRRMATDEKYRREVGRKIF